DTHVHDDLDQAGDLHGVAVVVLLLERRDDLVAVLLLQAGQGRGLCGGSHPRSLPVLRAMRTFWPFSSIRKPMRVGLPWSSTICTFEMWIGASWVTMPPVLAPRWGGRGSEERRGG